MRIVFLLALVAAAAAQSSTTCPKHPTYCLPTQRDGSIECPFRTLTGGEQKLWCRPVTITDVTKIISTTCTWLNRTSCADVQACAEGVRPTFTNCCPDCKVPSISTTCPAPPDCSTGVLPKLSSGCLTCKVPINVCTEAQFTTCRTKEVPSCADGEKPVRGSDCCLSCEPVTSGCGSTTDFLSRVTKCATDYSSLPECAAGSLPRFNTDTCCLSCRIPAVKPPSNGVCTLDEFKACSDAVTECVAGEVPTKTSGCCMSCRRPERECSFIEVVKACSKIPACEDGEKPSPVAGSCCPSCRFQRPRPTCSPVCSLQQICVRTKTGPTCRAPFVRTLIVKAADAIKTALQDKDRAKTAILEMVQRFCDKPQNARICTLMSKLRDRLLVEPNTDGTINLVVADDDDDTTGTRRLLEDSPTLRPSDLLNAATDDAEARGGDVTITDAARVCPREPSREMCAAAKDTTFTQECKYYFKTFFCKPLTSIPVDSTSPPMTCTWEKMRACYNSSDTLPACAPDTRPTFDYSTCCPSCKFTKPTTEEPTCPVPAECAAGVSPARDDKGCLTCRVPVTRCTLAQYTACKAAMATLATCTADEKPVRTPDCCISCKPASTACGLDSDPDGLDRKTRCSTAFKDLPVCKAGTRPQFNRDTCCLTCRPEWMKPPPPRQGCTIEEFKTCIAKVHTCETGEEPQRNDVACCKTCRRPERKCQVKDVVANCRKVPACDAGERPVRVEGSCCPSCRPTRKKCIKACGSGEKCRRVMKVMGGVAGAAAEMCRKVKTRTYKLAWGQALANLTADEVSDAIIEIVNRFCDRREAAFPNVTSPSVCDNKYNVVENIVARIQARQDAQKTAEVEVDVDESPPSRRLLLSVNPPQTTEAQLLDEALTDAEASGTFAFTAPSSLPPVTSSATATVAGAAVLFLPLLLL